MPSNKENSINFPKRSLSNSASKQALSQSDITNSTGLTNEFAGYLDYVRKLEGENEHLKSEKEDLIESCQAEINAIKSTYGCEIDALRKALDDLTKEKCTSDYHNDKLLEENNTLKIKFARKIDAINDLEKKFEEAESNLIKNRRTIEKFGEISQENCELSRKNSLINEQLKCEINKRTEAENRFLTLSDEVEFLRKVNTNTINRETNSNMSTIKSETYYSEKYDNDMKEMREELTEEFDQYKNQMEAAFNQKLEELSIMNSKLNEKCNKIYNEKKSLQNEIHSLQNETADLKTKICALETRESRYKEKIDNINKEHESFIGDFLEENKNLKSKMQEMSEEMAVMLNEKIAKEKEAYIFRTMLKGEKSRFNLSDANSVKRRKVEDNGDYEITAWAKNNIKIICNSSDNNDNYLELINDSINDVNLNEWKVEIETSAGVVLLYTFPPRLICAGKSLKVWSIEKDVAEDEDNLIMNMKLPSLDSMACRLSNDMYEIEASFDLKKSMATAKRKILKAKKGVDNKEKCSIM